MQWNDSQQAPCASVLTHKIQQQWQRQEHSVETQKLLCVSCQVLLLMEREQQGTERAGGLFYCYQPVWPSSLTSLCLDLLCHSSFLLCLCLVTVEVEKSSLWNSEGWKSAQIRQQVSKVLFFQRNIRLKLSRLFPTIRPQMLQPISIKT